MWTDKQWVSNYTKILYEFYNHLLKKVCIVDQNKLHNVKKGKKHTRLVLTFNNFLQWPSRFKTYNLEYGNVTSEI